MPAAAQQPAIEDPPDRVLHSCCTVDRGRLRRRHAAGVPAAGPSHPHLPNGPDVAAVLALPLPDGEFEGARIEPERQAVVVKVRSAFSDSRMCCVNSRSSWAPSQRSKAVWKTAIAVWAVRLAVGSSTPRARRASPRAAATDAILTSSRSWSCGLAM